MSSDPNTRAMEDVMERLMASGHFASKNDLLMEGLRLVEKREKAQDDLEAALQRGIDDMEAGRVHDADEVFDMLEKRFSDMIKSRPAQ
jgi:antitoxin ParD1/3/4